MLERERKYKLRPKDVIYLLQIGRVKETLRIEQHYPIIEEDREVRYRYTEYEDRSETLITIKKGKGEEREEIEDKVTYSDYLLNQKHTPIEKKRHIIEINLYGKPLELELDVFLNFNIIFLEIEGSQVEILNFEKLHPQFKCKKTTLKNKDIYQKIQDYKEVDLFLKQFGEKCRECGGQLVWYDVYYSYVCERCGKTYPKNKIKKEENNEKLKD